MKLYHFKNPQLLINELGDQCQQLWSRQDAETKWTPHVDIKETISDFRLLVDLPGVELNNIEIHIDKGTLSIKGQRLSLQNEEKPLYHRIERSYGQFYREFSLPENVDAEKIAASSYNGVLEIILPKAEKPAEKRKIEIQVK